LRALGVFVFFVFLARVSVGLKTMLWVCKTILPKKSQKKEEEEENKKRTRKK